MVHSGTSELLCVAMTEARKREGKTGARKREGTYAELHALIRANRFGQEGNGKA